MITLKKFAGAIVIAAFILPTLQSCSKLASNKKLDGVWNLTAATGSGSSLETSTWNGSTNTTTGTSTMSYNGTTVSMTQTQTSGGLTFTNTTTFPMTMSVEFAKKEGTYSTTTISTTVDSNWVDYYSYDGTTYNYEGTLDVAETNTSTEVESGTFQITGGNGDAEKNSIILFLPEGRTDATSTAIAYFNGGTAFSGTSSHYYDDNGTYRLLPTSDSENTTETFVSGSGEIWTVTENKKGAMKVSSTENSTWTNGTDTYNDDSTNDFDFEEE